MRLSGVPSVQCLKYFVGYFFQREFIGSPLGDNHKVHRRVDCVAVGPEGLSHQTLDPVAIRCPFSRLFRNNKAQAAWRALGLDSYKTKMVSVKRAAFGEDPVELTLFPYAARRWKRQPPSRVQLLLGYHDGKHFASATTATGKDIATIFGCHAGTKAVDTLTTDTTGVVGSLLHSFLLRKLASPRHVSSYGGGQSDSIFVKKRGD